MGLKHFEELVDALLQAGPQDFPRGGGLTGGQRSRLEDALGDRVGVELYRTRPS
jgi:hypothetical protein